MCKISTSRALSLAIFVLLVMFASTGASEIDSESCDLNSGPSQRAARCFSERGTEFCLPDIIGVCCVRSGSTSLAAYMNAHPSMTYGIRKEHQAFRFSSRDRVPQNMIKEVTAQRSGIALQNPSRSSQQPEHLISVLHGRWHWAEAPVNFTSVSTRSLRNAGWYGSTGADGGGRKFMVQMQPGLDWKTYARQFPIDNKVPGTNSPVRFDFDPTYMGGITSLASAQALLSTVGATTRLLAIFRKPAHQACSKLVGKGKGSDWQVCTRAAAAVNCSGSDSPWNSAPCREGFETLNDAQVCPQAWMWNVHTFCYAEHVTAWMGAGFSLDRMHFVKSEDLKDPLNRRTIVEGVLRFAGIAVDEVSRRPMMEATAGASEEEGSSLDAFEAELHQEHNNGRGSVDSPEEVCAATLSSSPDSYLPLCNIKLAELLGDDKWLWAD